jgi:hypothetical protein
VNIVPLLNAHDPDPVLFTECRLIEFYFASIAGERDLPIICDGPESEDALWLCRAKDDATISRLR